MKLTVKLKGGRWYATGIGRINSLVHENAAHTPSLRDVFRALEETLEVQLPKEPSATTKKPAKANRRTATVKPIDDNATNYRATVLAAVFPGIPKATVKRRLLDAPKLLRYADSAVESAIAAGRLHRNDRDLARGVLSAVAWDE
jgi:hypothetical protein